MASTLEVLNSARLAFYDNKPTATLFNAVSPSIPNNTLAPVTWDSETDDNWNGHSTSSNTSRYTAQVAGLYSLSGTFSVVGNTTGYRLAVWYLNGTEINGTRNYVPNPGTTINCTVPLVGFNVRLAVGDYVEMAVFQNSGGALNLVLNASFMCVTFDHF